MRYLSQSKAAKLAGVSRGTIANRIEAGVLSSANAGIDPAELVRVFPEIDSQSIDHFLATGEILERPDPPAPPVRSPINDSDSQAALRAAAANTEWLQELVADQRATSERKERELRAIIERKDDELRQLQRETAEREARREAVWERQFEMVTGLLPAPEKVDVEMAEPPRSLWRRLFG